MADIVKRDALNVYLEDLSTIECIIYRAKIAQQEIDEKETEFTRELSQKKSDLERVVSNKEYEAEQFKRCIPTPPQKNHVKKRDSHIPYLVIGCIILVIGFLWMTFCFLIFVAAKGLSSFFSLENLIGFMEVGTPPFILGLALTYLGVSTNKDNNKKLQKTMEQEEINYQQEIQERNELINDYNDKINELNNLKRETKEKIDVLEKEYDDFENQKNEQESLLNAEIEKYENLLAKAYSSNIIPLPFRNRWCVMYIYNFLKTSSLTLSDALLHCNMEEIKESMNTLIEQSAESIILQRQQLASSKATEQRLRNIESNSDKLLLNSEISLNYTERMLDEARRSSENMETAAQYAQISATNSDLSLQLQKEQLAYQKVDFWLKNY